MIRMLFILSKFLATIIVYLDTKQHSQARLVSQVSEENSIAVLLNPNELDALTFSRFLMPKFTFLLQKLSFHSFSANRL